MGFDAGRTASSDLDVERPSAQPNRFTTGSAQLTLPPGEIIPGTRYRIVTRVGAGAMGAVYQAEHVDLEKRVALKTLLAASARDPVRQQERRLSKLVTNRRQTTMTCARTVFFYLATFCLVALGGCGSSTSEYKDSLTFGTGIGSTGFDLINEGTTFSVGIVGTSGAPATQGTIWFKLESVADMGDRATRIYINDGTYGTSDYPSLQSYGHYVLSSFRITDTGTFTVKGYYVAQVGPDIGKETFVAGSSINMVP